MNKNTPNEVLKEIHSRKPVVLVTVDSDNHFAYLHTLLFDYNNEHNLLVKYLVHTFTPIPHKLR